MAVVPSEVEMVVRHVLRVEGAVQGVGFRPFVYRLASSLDLSGFVGNDNRGVFIEVEGSPARLEVFSRRLRDEAPPLSRIERVLRSVEDPVGVPGFAIVDSRGVGRAGAPGSVDTVETVDAKMTPDASVCSECLAEMADPNDRRFRYPFINCTNCGPRFTIIRRMPYDRPNTTMAGFEMCGPCRHEYLDPMDRRYHAQPVACAECGPRIWFEPVGAPDSDRADGANGADGADEGGGRGRIEGTDAVLAVVQRALAGGKIVAIKGLGGFHLACDAASPEAVAELRRRKQRPDKPFAVMVADIEAAKALAMVGEAEAAALTGVERPIVLLEQAGSGAALGFEASPGPRPSVTRAVNPGSPLIGLVLPYTPLHHLLFARVPGANADPPSALVMTSGNLSDEPIAYENDDARERLAHIADCWLFHDRPIHVPCDDSVVRMGGGRVIPIRQGRGHAPLSVRMPAKVPALLAVGGELKNTFCLASGRNAWVSQHIGDMGSIETLAAFERSTTQFSDVYNVVPDLVAADRHPGYQTRRWAEKRSAFSPAGPSLINHHHAHVAAAMAEHDLPPDARVIGVAFDGTGYGDDGAIWGGEVLLAGYGSYERRYHLSYVPLPGGDAAIRKPYRAALAHLWAAGVEWTADLPPVAAAPAAELPALERQLELNFHCVPTSSMGRLFDAVSSIVGLRHTVSYEAQAAIEMEFAAASSGNERPYRLPLSPDSSDRTIDVGGLIRAIVNDVRAGVPAAAIAIGFHRCVAQLIADLAVNVRAETGEKAVVLTGGVFQNALLDRLAVDALTEEGFKTLTHRVVPCNDGGLALGQAAIAGYRSLLGGA